MRVLTLLGSDLELAERKLYVEGQNAAYSYLEAEWPNMKHVIMMDNQCTEACYEAYLKVKCCAVHRMSLADCNCYTCFCS